MGIRTADRSPQVANHSGARQPQQPVEKALPEQETRLAEQEIRLQFDYAEVPLAVSQPKIEDTKPLEKAEPNMRAAVSQSGRQTPAPPKAWNKGAARVCPSSRNAASQTTGIRCGAVARTRSQLRMMAYREPRQTSPSGAWSRKEQGLDDLRFCLNGRAATPSASRVHPSGFPKLDVRACSVIAGSPSALSVFVLPHGPLPKRSRPDWKCSRGMSFVKCASSVLAPPAGVNETITAPLRFTAW